MAQGKLSLEKVLILLEEELHRAESDFYPSTVSWGEVVAWRRSVGELLELTFPDNSGQLNAFKNARDYVDKNSSNPAYDFYKSSKSAVEVCVTRIKRAIKDPDFSLDIPPSLIADKQQQTDKSKVFVVHGHDEAIKKEVENFIISLNLKPIILNKQTFRSRTIIESIENHSDVGFAVVLLTADDIGSAYDMDFRKFHERARPKTFVTAYVSSTEEERLKLALESVQRDVEQAEALVLKLNFRARQNVIFEFGYFIAKIGRENVAVLLGKGVEKPSDIEGILYISLEGGEWKEKLIQDLKDAGLPIKTPKK